jgi:hypothetical protein
MDVDSLRRNTAAKGRILDYRRIRSDPSLGRFQIHRLLWCSSKHIGKSLLEAWRRCTQDDAVKVCVWMAHTTVQGTIWWLNDICPSWYSFLFATSLMWRLHAKHTMPTTWSTSQLRTSTCQAPGKCGSVGIARDASPIDTNWSLQHGFYPALTPSQGKRNRMFVVRYISIGEAMGLDKPLSKAMMCF